MCKKSCKARNFLLKLILENSGLLVAQSILIKSQNATILETLTVKVFSLHSAWKFKNHNDFHVILLIYSREIKLSEGKAMSALLIHLQADKVGGKQPFKTDPTAIPSSLPPKFFSHFLTLHHTPLSECLNKLNYKNNQTKFVLLQFCLLSNCIDQPTEI